jgi:hypothetical protein
MKIEIINSASTQLEKLLITSYKKDLLNYISSNPEAFDELINLALEVKQPFSWRASWLLWSCMEKNDKRIQSYVKRIIKLLPFRNDNQQREYLKILYEMEISEKDEGELFDRCVQIWKEIDNKPAVKMNAFKILLKISERYPELLEEIVFLTNKDYMHTLSPGVKHSISKLLKGISK